MWLGGLVVRTSNSQLLVAGLNPSNDTACYFWHRWPSLAGKLYWDVNITRVNSALHPSRVAKSSTSFGWGKSGKVTAAGWQVTLALWFPVVVRWFHKLLYLYLYHHLHHVYCVNQHVYWYYCYYYIVLFARQNALFETGNHPNVHVADKCISICCNQAFLNITVSVCGVLLSSEMWLAKIENGSRLWCCKVCDIKGMLCQWCKLGCKHCCTM